MSDNFIEIHNNGIVTIDTGHRRPGLVASHLLIQEGKAVFIDVGTSQNVDRLMQSLSKLNLKEDDVEAVIVTHVHLDHAGGAGALMRLLPKAKLIVHPRGARHMIDPSKLQAGASAVYGAQLMQSLFGEIVAVDAARVIEAGEGFNFSLNQRELQFINTPGHARHHFCIVDKLSESIFTGDTFGLSYREFDVNEAVFIFPTTTPIQFDPVALHNSIDILLAFNPEQMYLTHFGRVSHPEKLAKQLHAQIDLFVDLARSVKAESNRYAALVEKLNVSQLVQLREHGCRLNDDECIDLLSMDTELNAQGLIYWLEHEDQ